MHTLEFTKEEAFELSTRQRRRRRVPLLSVLAVLCVILTFVAVSRRKKGANLEEEPMPLDSGQDMTMLDGGDDDKLDDGSTTPDTVDEQQTPEPSTSPLNPVDSDDDCNGLYDCQTDRLGHGSPLLAGQALCNEQYRFGLTPEGVFQWHDCGMKETKVVYEPTDDHDTVRLFVMSEVGTLRLVGDEEKVIWHKDSTLKIVPTKDCLSRPLLDCPYLHLHKSGDVVLNSIDPNNGNWSDRKIERCFDDFYH